MEEKEKLWSELDEVVESITREERGVTGADFYGHVDEEVMGRFWLQGKEP